MNVNIIH